MWWPYSCAATYILGERAALGAELRLELIEEAQVKVDGLVQRAVERPDRARGGAALRAHAVAEERDSRLHEVLLARRGERALPVRVEALDDTEQAAVLALVGVGSGLALVDELASDRSFRRGAAEAADDVAQVPAGQEDEGDDDDGPEPAAHGDAAPADAAPAHVADASRIEVDIGSEGHGLVTPYGTSICTPRGRARRKA